MDRLDSERVSSKSAKPRRSLSFVVTTFARQIPVKTASATSTPVTAKQNGDIAPPGTSFHLNPIAKTDQAVDKSGTGHFSMKDIVETIANGTQSTAIACASNSGVAREPAAIRFAKVASCRAVGYSAGKRKHTGNDPAEVQRDRHLNQHKVAPIWRRGIDPGNAAVGGIQRKDHCSQHDRREGYPFRAKDKYPDEILGQVEGKMVGEAFGKDGLVARRGEALQDEEGGQENVYDGPYTKGKVVWCEPADVSVANGALRHKDSHAHGRQHLIQ